MSDAIEPELPPDLNHVETPWLLMELAKRAEVLIVGMRPKIRRPTCRYEVVHGDAVDCLGMARRMQNACAIAAEDKSGVRRLGHRGEEII